MRVFFDTVGGISTRYYRGGQGVPLLLLHGVGVTAEVWWKTMAPLSESCDVIAPDMLGSGFTAAGSYEGGPIHPHVIDHLVALVDHLELREFAVAGSSLGALFAALLYFRLPKRVTRLVLVSSGSMFNSDEEYVEGWSQVLANGRTAFENPTYDVCKARSARVFHDPAKIPDAMLMMQMSSYALPGALDLFLKRTQGMLDPAAMANYRVVSRLEDIRVPVLSVFGGNDPRANRERAQQENARIAEGQFVLFEQCGHYPQLEHPEKFNSLVREFIGSEKQ